MQSWRGGKYTPGRRLPAAFSGVVGGTGRIFRGVMIFGSERDGAPRDFRAVQMALNQRMEELAPT